MAKAKCPSCSSRMRAKDKFCGACGRGNPLFPAKTRARGRAAKSAGAYAPVLSIGAFRQSSLGADFYRETDPERREAVAGIITKSAAAYGDAADAGRAWSRSFTGGAA